MGAGLKSLESESLDAFDNLPDNIYTFGPQIVRSMVDVVDSIESDEYGVKLTRLHAGGQRNAVLGGVIKNALRAVLAYDSAGYHVDSPRFAISVAERAMEGALANYLELETDGEISSANFSVLAVDDYNLALEYVPDLENITAEELDGYLNTVKTEAEFRLVKLHREALDNMQEMEDVMDDSPLVDEDQDELDRLRHKRNAELRQEQEASKEETEMFTGDMDLDGYVPGAVSETTELPGDFSHVEYVNPVGMYETIAEDDIELSPERVRSVLLATAIDYEDTDIPEDQVEDFIFFPERFGVAPGSVLREYRNLCDTIEIDSGADITSQELEEVFQDQAPALSAQDIADIASVNKPLPEDGKVHFSEAELEEKTEREFLSEEVPVDELEFPVDLEPIPNPVKSDFIRVAPKNFKRK